MAYQSHFSPCLHLFRCFVCTTDTVCSGIFKIIMSFPELDSFMSLPYNRFFNCMNHVGGGSSVWFGPVPGSIPLERTCVCAGRCIGCHSLGSVQRIKKRNCHLPNCFLYSLTQRKGVCIGESNCSTEFLLGVPRQESL